MGLDAGATLAYPILCSHDVTIPTGSIGPVLTSTCVDCGADLVTPSERVDWTR